MAARILKLAGQFAVRHPWWTLSAYGCLLAASLLVTRDLEFRTGQNDLVSRDLPYNQRYLEFLRDFSDLEFLYVVIEVGEDPERAVKVADAVVEEVRRLDGHIEWVLHRIPPQAMRFGILHQDADQIARLVQTIREQAPRLSELSRADSLERLFGSFASFLSAENLSRGQSGSELEFLAQHAVAVLDASMDGSIAVLDGKEPPRLVASLERAGELSLRERGYFATDNGKYLLVEISPAKDESTLELIEGPLAELRGALERVKTRFLQEDGRPVRMGLTGRPVLQADEMMATRDDMSRATLAALAGVFVLFVLAFRRLTRPLLAVLALGVAIVLTFGLAALTIGHLTILSIVFTAMLVGLGIDFGIHFIARYAEELQRDGDIEGAVMRTLATTGVSIGTGAVTTAGAFYTTLLVDFQGLRELGWIAGGGVLLSFATMVTLLPALIALADRRRTRLGRPLVALPLRIPLLDGTRKARWWIAGAALVLTAAGVPALDGLPYSSNLLELQPRGLESVEYELRLIEDSNKSTWFAAFVCDGLESARARASELQSLVPHVVGSVESIADYLPSDQDAKLQLLRGAWPLVREIEMPRPSPAVAPQELAAALDSLQRSLFELADLAASRPSAANGSTRAEVETIFALAERSDRLAERLSQADSAKLERLARFQERWIGELRELVAAMRDALEPLPMALGDLPEDLRRRLVSRDGDRFIVYAYASQDLWQEEPMEEFIQAVRGVSEDVTGAPIQVYESSRRMRDGFLLAAAYSIGMVFLFLLADLRSLGRALLAMVPLLLGLAWLIEFLPLAGIRFNLANFFALPVLIGCGVDGGVHIVHRYLDERGRPSSRRTTLAAVTLSFLTTLVGFGALMLARHRGVASLGLMMVLGLTAILLASVVVLPALLSIAERRTGRKRCDAVDGARPACYHALGQGQREEIQEIQG